MDEKIKEKHYSRRTNFDLSDTLKRIYADLKEKEKKGWDKFGDGVWEDVIRWVSEEYAKQIFKSVITTNNVGSNV